MESDKVSRAARLRAAGLTYQEIASALGVSRQHAHRMLDGVDIPEWGTHEIKPVSGGYAIVSPGTDPRILHALLKAALTRAGQDEVKPPA